jgi:hypothetical protein
MPAHWRRLQQCESEKQNPSRFTKIHKMTDAFADAMIDLY